MIGFILIALLSAECALSQLCGGGQQWNACGCRRTCIKPECDPSEKCTSDCMCEDGLVIDQSGECVAFHDCRGGRCPNAETVFEPFCGGLPIRHRICPSQRSHPEERILICSEAGCYCKKEGYVIDARTNHCIPINNCPKPQ